MKRSQIRSAIADARQFIGSCGFKLPMFADWTIDEWKAHKAELSTIIATMRGWDVTDFGSGDFDKVGAVLFTIRNGVLGTRIGCPYAEKLIIMKEGQELPLHFHFSKTEDIINRGGAELFITVYNSLPDGAVDYKSDVTYYSDGIAHTVPAGTAVELKPGCSMTITPYLYHLFSVKGGNVMVGEVSAVNDDNVDNHFAVESKRFTGIEEDEPVKFPLCNEYEKVL